MKYQSICLQNGIFFQYDNQQISWDIYGSKVLLSDAVCKELYSYFLSLPVDAFDTNKHGLSGGFSFSRTGYNYICLSKKYLEVNISKLTTDIKEILLKLDANNDFKLEVARDEEKIIWEIFKEDRELLEAKYSYWKKKKHDNQHYNRFRILERDGFKCKICGRFPPEVVLHIDHWTPKARGGLDIYENLITLCGECNISKLAQIPKFKIEDVRDR
jgi:NAD-dependent dihydropyrimidine dehydrogenase PreA subunit